MFSQNQTPSLHLLQLMQLEDDRKKANAFSNTGNYSTAANFFEWVAINTKKLDDWGNALANYLRINHYGKVAFCYAEIAKLGYPNEWLLAAKYYSDAGDARNAADCFEAHAKLTNDENSWNNAATCHFQVKNFKDAALCSQKLAEITKTRNDWHIASFYYRQAHDYSKAADCMKMLATQTNEISDWQNAAHSYSKNLQYLEAADCYLEIAQQTEKAEDHQKRDSYLAKEVEKIASSLNLNKQTFFQPEPPQDARTTRPTYGSSSWCP